MRNWYKNVIGVILILIGFAAIVFGEIDDSPGLMLIGLIVIVVSLYTLIRRFIKRKKTRGWGC